MTYYDLLHASVGRVYLLGMGDEDVWLANHVGLATKNPEDMDDSSGAFLNRSPLLKVCNRLCEGLAGPAGLAC